MKAFRIIQLIGFVLVGAYLILLHFSAPNAPTLPVILPMIPLTFAQVPSAAALAVCLILGFIAGAIPGQVGLWRRRREVHRLERRIQELEQHRPNYLKTRSDEDEEPMIPDRRPDFSVPAEDTV